MTAVLISGAGGFIGSHIAQVLSRSGFRVVGVSRKGESNPFFDAVYSGYLLEPLNIPFRGEKIDVFIHCAYHSGPDDHRINVEGTRLWAEQAEQDGVRKQVFLSSISAQNHSLSSYGQAKYDLEKWFLECSHLVLRPGLVIGPGGIFQKMIDMVRKNILLPLPDGGGTYVYLTGIRLLCDIVKDTLKSCHEWPAGKTLNLFQPEPVTIKDVLAAIRKAVGTRCLFIPVPSRMLKVAVGMLERIPFLELGVSKNNLIGLQQNKQLEWPSDLGLLGYPSSPLEILVKGALSKEQK